jgi:hypothetical protein
VAHGPRGGIGNAAVLGSRRQVRFLVSPICCLQSCALSWLPASVCCTLSASSCLLGGIWQRCGLRITALGSIAGASFYVHPIFSVPRPLWPVAHASTRPSLSFRPCSILRIVQANTATAQSGDEFDDMLAEVRASDAAIPATGSSSSSSGSRGASIATRPRNAVSDGTIIDACKRGDVSQLQR